MDRTFNALERGARYVFVFGQGIESINGIFHDIRQDGTLTVAGNHSGARRSEDSITFYINPDNVIYARRAV